MLSLVSYPFVCRHTYAGLAVDESVYAVGVHTREVFVQELLMEQGSPGNNVSMI